MAIKLKTPLDSAAARALRAGDMCLLTGELYTARDAAHKRLCTLLEAGQPLPACTSAPMTPMIRTFFFFSICALLPCRQCPQHNARV